MMNTIISADVAGPENDADRFQSTRARAHPHCVVCSPVNPLGLGQEFVLQSDWSVEGNFSANKSFEGYPGLLHGGVTAALLDGAMTNCLFARGIHAVTAELKVRYRGRVTVGDAIVVRASLQETHGRLLLLRAELRQGNTMKAVAFGKFVEIDD